MDDQELQKRLAQFAVQATREGTYYKVAGRWLQSNWDGSAITNFLEDLTVEIAQAVIKDVEQYLLRKHP